MGGEGCVRVVGASSGSLVRLGGRRGNVGPQLIIGC